MKFLLEIDGNTCELSLEPGAAGNYTATLVGHDLPVSALNVQATHLSPGILSLQISDQAFRCVLDESPAESAIHVGGERFNYTLADPRSLHARRVHAGAVDGPVILIAPMPGRIVRLLAAVGDVVQARQGILVIEAMKMQNELKSPKAGRVAEIRFQPGETVAVGEVLAVIE